MGWHLVERVKSYDILKEQLWTPYFKSYATLTGRLWTTLLFLLRIVVITSIGEHVYGDEVSAFDCNVKNPGCPNVCYSFFAPISQIRFWGIQVIAVATPGALFVVYTIQTKNPLKHDHSHEENDSTAIPRRKASHAFITITDPKKLRSVHRKTKKVSRQIKIMRAYVVQGIVRCIMEVLFLWIQIDMYGFTVDNRFECPGGDNSLQNPCPPHGVVCWVSRAMEKTIFLRFMFAMSIMSIVMTLIELVQLTYKRCFRDTRRLLKAIGCFKEGIDQAKHTQLTSPDDSSSKYLRTSSVEEQADIYDECEAKRSFSHFI